METIELVLWIIGILAFFLITTFLLKRFKNVSTFYVGSMIKTKRFLPLLDKFSRHKRILNLFADIGLVLGFGAIAVDFIIGRKLGRKMRVLVFISISIFFSFRLDSDGWDSRDFCLFRWRLTLNLFFQAP